MAAMLDQSPTAQVFPFTAARLRALMQSSAQALGLAAPYVLHSLRHGGATCDYIAGRPVAAIVLRGRWASFKSARTYIQRGQALLLDAVIPHNVQQIAQVVVLQPLAAIAQAQEHFVGAG